MSESEGLQVLNGVAAYFAEVLAPESHRALVDSGEVHSIWGVVKRLCTEKGVTLFEHASDSAAWNRHRRDAPYQTALNRALDRTPHSRSEIDAAREARDQAAVASLAMFRDDLLMAFIISYENHRKEA